MADLRSTPTTAPPGSAAPYSPGPAAAFGERDPVFLETAARIGAQLAREAIWHGTACNWIGPRQGVPDMSWQSQLDYGACGATLYDGTSGIALFLGQLYALTGEAIFRRTAVGAINQALACKPGASGERWGLYSGWIGIAYATERVATHCDYPAAAAAAGALLAGLAGSELNGAALDVIDGAAGAIPALLWLYGRRRHADTLDLATRLGDLLLARASRRAHGWAWDTIATPSDQLLTGFGHGAAGIAWGLLELWRASGQGDYRAGAEYGFAYERFWFDAPLGSWPDFRRPAGAPQAAAPGRWPAGMAWCHGAPGGALARLRAFELTGAEIYRREAAAALAATSRVLAATEKSDHDFSLCHGRAGQADALLSGATLLGNSEYLAAAALAGRSALDALQQRRRPWPCGLPGAGETPGLMLGLAGIGYFYLRLYAPTTTPSILLVQPDSTSCCA